LLHLSL